MFDPNLEFRHRPGVRVHLRHVKATHEVPVARLFGDNDGASVTGASAGGLGRQATKEEDIRTSVEPVSASSQSDEPPPHEPPSQRPPPFSSLYQQSSPSQLGERSLSLLGDCYSDLNAYAPAPPFEDRPSSSAVAVAETKASLPVDNKREPSSKEADDDEPPPPYAEGSSPLDSFTYLMAAAGGAASILTQVQQGGPPVNALAGEHYFSIRASHISGYMLQLEVNGVTNELASPIDVGGDENISLDLRGSRFTLSREELLTLPEFVLLSLFPNGLLPEGHMNAFHEGDVYPVDYDPASLQYMLDFFRNVAQTIPSRSPSPTSHDPNSAMPIEPMAGSAREMLQDRAGIIVLREDLDFYAIPPKSDIEQPEMIDVKRAAGKALLKQDGIFSGLRRSEESGTTEQHLIEMLTAGGFNSDDRWGHRAGEPNKAVICSLALARLRTDIKGNDVANSTAVGMAQKLLLFWRKPARRCWWEGVDLENVEGVEGKLKVWIRRVWTLEMSVIGLR
ncbi:MAG: hypothetical protein M4579_005892 [Chaenotheca gracillima]|nr:MAG: hypothetical protein M4579_005892 [Chaenotheca gracillima]